jgi:hypothetical protein
VALAGFHDHIAALATIAAGGTAARHEFLPAKSHAAVAAVAGFNTNSGFIYEHSENLTAETQMAQRKQIQNKSLLEIELLEIERAPTKHEASNKSN